MNHLTLKALAELSEDDEFALRFRAAPQTSANVIVDYFTQRGIERGDATFLAMAYIVGSTHASIYVDRSLARIAARLVEKA